MPLSITKYLQCANLIDQMIPGTRAINTTGAGDALMAGLAAANLQGLGLKEAAYQAIAAATITLQHNEAVNPDISLAALQELREDIHHA